MSRLTILLGGLVLSILLGSSGAGAAGFDTDERALFNKTEWSTVDTLSQVDTAVLSALVARFGTDQRIAASGAPFESTDVDSGRPTRRFILAGHFASRWFVLYEHGGRGHHLILVVFDSRGGSPTPSLLARGNAGVHDDIAGWKVDLPQLRRALTSGTMSLDEVTKQYY
jgi:hypothetical protein